MIHVGIDTVKLNGEGFEVFVTDGQKVKKGDPMLKLELDFLRENALSLVSPIVCAELPEGSRVQLLQEGEIRAGEALFSIEGGSSNSAESTGTGEA